MADAEPATEKRITTEELEDGSRASGRKGDNDLGAPLRHPEDTDEGLETSTSREPSTAFGPQQHATSLWSLKATQFLCSAGYTSMAKFGPVFLHDRGISLTGIGALSLIGPFSFFGSNLFWSMLINRTGAFKTILVITQVIGASGMSVVLLREVTNSLVLTFLVIAFAGAFLSSAPPIIDSLCLTLVEENPGSGEGYGDQHLWSALGWGTASLLIGKLLDMYGWGVGFASFTFLIVTLLTILVWRFPSPKPRRRGVDDSQGSDAAGRFWHSLLTFDVLWFFMNWLIYGLSTGLIESLLLVYLDKKHGFPTANNFLRGSAVATMCVFQIPGFKFADRLWTRCGVRLTGVMAGCQVVVMLQCIFYASLPHSWPWLVLLIEPLHGSAFAVMWIATVEYGKRLAPPSHIATMQVAVFAVYASVAVAFGAAIWAVVAEPPKKGGIGFRRAFIVDAVLLLVWTVIWQIGLQIKKWRVRRQHSASVPTPYSRQAPDAIDAQEQGPPCSS